MFGGVTGNIQLGGLTARGSCGVHVVSSKGLFLELGGTLGSQALLHLGGVLELKDHIVVVRILGHLRLDPGPHMQMQVLVRIPLESLAVIPDLIAELHRISLGRRDDFLPQRRDLGLWRLVGV